MPREAARLFLKVTDVRVERLQEISRIDARAEGMGYLMENGGEPYIYSTFIDSFRYLWDNLNAKRGYGWEQNPWVWVYEFERVNHGKHQL